MTLRSIYLTLAERYMLEYIFGNLTSVKTAEAGMIKPVRKTLETKPASKAVEKFDRKAREAGLPPLTWEDLDDPSDYTDRLSDVQALVRDSKPKTDEEDTERKKTIERIDNLAERLVEIQDEVDGRGFSIDDLYLKWLRDSIVDKFDLAKRTVVGPNGQAHTVEFPPTVAQIDVFASLVDKINLAIASAPAP